MGKSFFEQMKDRRIQIGMTIKDLSIETGISEGYISHLENGNRNNPSFNTILKLCTALGMSINLKEENQSENVQCGLQLMDKKLVYWERERTPAEKEKLNVFKEKNMWCASILETIGQFFYVYAMSGNSTVNASIVGSYCIFVTNESRFLKNIEMCHNIVRKAFT